MAAAGAARPAYARSNARICAGINSAHGAARRLAPGAQTSWRSAARRGSGVSGIIGGGGENQRRRRRAWRQRQRNGVMASAKKWQRSMAWQ